MEWRGKKRASADVGLMFVAYNLRRLINIIGLDEFKKHLNALAFIFKAKSGYGGFKIARLSPANSPVKYREMEKQKLAVLN